jgi:hypothetical protein
MYVLFNSSTVSADPFSSDGTQIPQSWKLEIVKSNFYTRRAITCSLLS